MSLYSFSSAATMPALQKPQGVHFSECSDAVLLSALNGISVEEVRRRLTSDHLAFVAFLDGRPAAFGWMASGKATIGELNHAFVLPERHRYLWNFRTLAEFRGLGIYPALLQFILEYERPHADYFWILHAPENKASQSGIVKAGFCYVGKAYVDSRGAVAMQAEPDAAVYEAPLEEMGFEVSAHAAASCWNCSSPYLKKRSPQCCCTASQTPCTHEGALLVA